jgi:hypothetical protein
MRFVLRHALNQCSDNPDLWRSGGVAGEHRVYFCNRDAHGASTFTTGVI